MGVDGTGAGVDSTGAEVALVLALKLDDDDDDMTMGIGDLEKSDDGTATSAGTDNVVVVKWGTWPFCGMGL